MPKSNILYVGGALRRATTVGLLLLALGGLPMPTVAQSLEVESFRWTNQVDKVSKQFDLIYPSKIGRRDIFLWTQIKGDQNLLGKLQSSDNGSIRIRHQWFSNESGGFVVEEDAVIDLDVGRKADLQKLAYEVDSQGFFRWRVWSSRRNLFPGLWRVDVVTDEGDSIDCVIDTVTQPCKLYLEVQ